MRTLASQRYRQILSRVILFLLCLIFTNFIKWSFYGSSDGKESACRVWSLGQEDPLEKDMATHSSVLAWKTPWAEEPGRPQSMGLQRVRHDWVNNTSFMRWTGKVWGVVKGSLESPFWSVKTTFVNQRQFSFSILSPKNWVASPSRTDTSIYPCWKVSPFPLAWGRRPLWKAQRQHPGSSKSIWTKGKRGKGNRRQREDRLRGPPCDPSSQGGQARRALSCRDGTGGCGTLEHAREQALLPCVSCGGLPSGTGALAAAILGGTVRSLSSLGRCCHWPHYRAAEQATSPQTGEQLHQRSSHSIAKF